MTAGTHISKAFVGLTIVFALASLGSNGSCADMAGPNYGSSGYGSSGYGQPGYGQAGSGQAVQGGQTFYAPSFGGNRVDWCLNWATNCGGPAANAFCQRVGYAQATAWNQAPNIGAQTPTLVLGDNAICNQPGCSGFQSITCQSGGGYVGPGPKAVQPPQQVRFTAEPNTNRPGMDYRNVTLSKATPGQCKNICRQESKCRAFTYVNPGVQGPQARCWLKSGVPAPVADGCCYSGVKQ